MAFPRKLLNSGEEVVLDLRPHWSFFAGPLLVLLGTVAAAVAVAVLNLPDWLWLTLLVLMACNLSWLAGRLARWATTNFVVTTDRLVYRSGVVARHGKEIPLERLNDISFHQSLLGRLLRVGDLVIQSGAERGQQAFDHVHRPSQVQNEIHRQVEAARERNAQRMAGRRELSLPEQLERLDELRQRGVISRAEFESKKTQLLERM